MTTAREKESGSFASKVRGTEHVEWEIEVKPITAAREKK
jgi:hypothetical protein